MRRLVAATSATKAYSMPRAPARWRTRERRKSVPVVGGGPLDDGAQALLAEPAGADVVGDADEARPGRRSSSRRRRPRSESQRGLPSGASEPQLDGEVLLAPAGSCAGPPPALGWSSGTTAAQELPAGASTARSGWQPRTSAAWGETIISSVSRSHSQVTTPATRWASSRRALLSRRATSAILRSVMSTAVARPAGSPSSKLDAGRR